MLRRPAWWPAEIRKERLVTPYATEHVRLGTGLWVEEADVDAAISAVSRL